MLKRGFLTSTVPFLILIPSTLSSKREIYIYSKKGFQNLDRPTDSHRRVPLGKNGLEARTRAAVPQAAVSAGQRDRKDTKGTRNGHETIKKWTDDDVSDAKHLT